MATAIELSSHEIQVLCQHYLRESVTDKSFEVLRYSLRPTSDAPAGYLGRHLFLTVDVLIKDAEADPAQNLRQLHFFTKSAPSGIASRMEYLEQFGVFKKEIIVYKDVLPKLQAAVDATVAPKCYYADNNILVFENLTHLGYRMGAARDGLLNFQHLHCLLKDLAALHAGSLIYEVRTGKSIPELHAAAIVENAYPLNIKDDHMRMINFNNASTVCKEFIKTMPKYQEKLDFILANFTRHMFKIFELSKASTKYRNVFLHADLWANNTMFRYDKDGVTPIECRFVDFQLARYAPPALDLLTVLTIPTSSEFRAKHLPELLADYYRFLTEFLARKGLDIDNFLTKEEYYASIEDFRIAGVIESLLFSHLTILPPDLTQELTGSTDGFADFFNRRRIEICTAAFKKDSMYRARLTDMLTDLVDNYVLKDI